MRLNEFIFSINLDYMAEAEFQHRYMSMIDPITAMMSKLKTPFGELINSAVEQDLDRYREQMNWARKTFHTPPQISWYLRLIRCYYMNNIYAYVERSLKQIHVDRLNPEDQAETQRLRELTDMAIHRDIPQSNQGLDRDLFMVASQDFRLKMEHYFTQGIDGIDRFDPSGQAPRDVANALWEIEKKYNAQFGNTIRMKKDDEQGATLIMKFPDGSAWFNLNKSSCSVEAKAMGHCGNSASGDANETVLSYRTPVRGEHWEPHLTFILNTRNGSLGEMKGRNNDKPVPRYFPAIVALLKQPFIKRLVGGGYKPENNFKMTDLPGPESYKLIEEKPLLAMGGGGRDLMGLAQKWGQEHTIALIKHHPEIIQDTQAFAAMAQDWDMNETIAMIKEHPNFVSASTFPSVARNWDPETTIALMRQHPQIVDNVGLMTLARTQQWPSNTVIDLIRENPLWGTYKTILSMVGKIPNKEIEGFLKIRPEWKTPELLYAMANGKMTPRVVKALAAVFEEHGTDVPEYDPKKNVFILAKYDGVEDAVDSIFGSDSKMHTYLCDPDFASNWEFSYYDPNQGESLFDDLPKHIQTGIRRYTIATYPERVEEEGGEEDLRDSDILKILDDESDSIIDALRSGVYDGYRRGAENEAYEAAKKHLEDFDGGSRGSRGSFGIEMTGGLDEPVLLTVGPEWLLANAVDYANDQNLSNLIDIEDLDEPYNGWSDFDEETAVERATEEMPPEIEQYFDKKELAAYNREMAVLRKKNEALNKARMAEYKKQQKAKEAEAKKLGKKK